MTFSALDLFNIFGFSVGSLAITAAVFYGFFANIQEKNWKQNAKLSQQIVEIREQVKEQQKIIKELEDFFNHLKKNKCIIFSGKDSSYSINGNPV